MRSLLLSKKIGVFLIILVAILVGTIGAMGATRTASVTGSWNSKATWGGSNIPTTADAVIINSGITVTIPSDYAAVCTTINFTNGNIGAASISFTDATSTLVASGAVTIQRPGNGGLTNTINVGQGSLSCSSIAMSATTGTTRRSILTISTGTVTVSGNITTAGTASSITFSDAGTLYVGGTFGISAASFTADVGTVNYNNAGNQNSCAVVAYYNLTVSGSGTKTFATTPTVNGVLSLQGTATVIVTTGVITYGSNATIQYNTANSRTVTTEEWPAIFSGTGGVIILNTGVITLGAAKDITNNLSIASGSKANLGTYTHTVGSLTLGGIDRACGTWGYGPGTPPTNKDQTYFTSSTGYLTVGTIPSAPTLGTITQPTCTVATGSVDLSGLPTGNWTINPGSISGSGSSITISGLVAGTYNFTVTNSGGCISPASGNVVITAQSATPVNVTGNSASAADASATLSWTAPSGCYNEIMIVAKAASSVSGTPTGDGSGYNANLAFGSGTPFGGGFVVYKGTGSPQTVTNLTNGTLYYFKFFTRNGSEWSSGVETSATPSGSTSVTDYFRSAAAGPALWTDPGSWQSSHNNNNWFTATSAPTSSATSIVIQAGHTIYAPATPSSNNLTVNGTYEHQMNGGVIPTATWDANSTCLITGCTNTAPDGLDQIFGNFIMDSNRTTWIHFSPTAMSIQGNLEIKRTDNNNGNSYDFAIEQDITIGGDLIVSGGAYRIAYSSNRTQIINGNLILTGGSLILNSSNTSQAGIYVGTLTINGSVSISGGTLDLSGGNDSGDNGIINVKSNFSQTAGIITESGNATGSAINFNGTTKQTYISGGTVNNTVNFIVSDGAYLQMAAADTKITGEGGFTLSSEATLGITSTAGITSSGPNGNIQVTGTRTYDIGAKYIYNGTSSQNTGNGFIGANNLTIENSAGVTLSNAVPVSGTLSLTNGILTTTASNLLSVTTTATTAISGGSTSFINGPVKWSIGTGTYIFPVGKSTGNYLPFTLTTSTASSPVITVEAFSTDVGIAATFDATLSSISHTEYWQTTLNSGTFAGSVSLDRGTSISPLNVIAGSASQAGSFTSLDGSSSGSTGVSNSTEIGANRYFVLAEKKKSTLSIAATNQAAEPNSNGLFTITTSSQFATATTVNIIVSGTASNGADYTTISSSVTFPANQSAMTIPVSVIDDSSFEGPETVIITLNTGTNYTVGSPSEAALIIADNESPPVPSVSLTIDKPTIAENGGAAIVTAILSNIYNQSVVVYINYSGTASHPNDYVDPSSYSITIPAGSLSGTITITSKDDCAVEGDETVIVDIGSVTNAVQNGNQQVTTTIIDDDTYPTITLSADNLSIPENGGISIVKATLSNTFCQDVIISLGYSGTAAHPNDYPNPSSYSITVVAGSLSGTTTIASSNDYLVEGDETVVVGVQSTNIAGISAIVSPVTITIVDDDSYSFTVTPTSGLVTTETGGAATFTVVLNALTYNDVTIQLTSSDLTEGTVFPSSLTFTNGNFFTPQTVTVTGVNDALVDGNIAYTIKTSAAVSDNNDFKGIDPSDVSVTNIDNDGSSDNFWFMADAGINGNVASWVDQSGNNINATNTGSVSKVDNSINFNPSLSFSSVNRQFVISGTKNIQSIIVVNKTPDTNSDLAGLIGADGDKGIRLSNSVNELTPVVTPYLSWRGNNNSDDWVNTTNAGAGRINGISDANMLHSSKWHIANITRYQALSGTYYIGGYYSGRPYSGYIAEVMAFDNEPSDGAIESYLALKYGITLGNTSSIVNYISPSGTVIWTGSSTYQNDIAGLGKESIYMLDQKVSSSVNTPSGTSARVVMATDNDFTSSNQSARTSLSNGQYLIWGHNNLGVNSLTTDGSFDRVARIWKVENTGVSMAVNFQIDLTGFPNPSELSLILDDNANLSNGGTTVISLTNSSGNLFSASISFPIGTSYFTIGKCKPISVLVNSPVICAGSGGAAITASPSPAGTYSYSWTVPGGATNPGNVNSFNATIQGTYTVEITNVGGCKASGLGNLTVNPKPILTIHNPGAVCFPSTIDLTAAAVTSGSTSGLTYSYWTDSGASTALSSPSSLSTSGTYYIKGMIAATSCFDIQPVVVTINPLPSKYTVTGSGTYCFGGSGVVVGLSGSETGVNYQLYNGATKVGSPVSGTGDAISFGNQLAGTYTVMAALVNGDCPIQMNGSATVAVGDSEKPIISSCPFNTTASCSKDLPEVKTIAAFKALGGSASDNCTSEANLSVSASDVLDLNSGCKVNRTYTITDASGNKATCTQVFTITDVAKPVINCNDDLVTSPNTNGCAATLDITAPTAISDECSLVNVYPSYSYRLGNNASANLVTGTGSFTATFPEGITTINWTITDLCGNTSQPCTQTVQVGFNLTSISYDNGSSATGLGSGVEPMQTSTHEYFVDNKIPEIGYTYIWGLFETDGVTAVSSSLYTKAKVNNSDAHIKISFTTIPIGNYIISLIKTKNATTCKKQTTLPITVQSNSSFDVVLDNLGNQCQSPGGGLTTISWNVTFPNVITEPFMFSYSIKLGGTVVATGNVTNITYAAAIPVSGLSAGAQTSKSANSRAVVIYYSLYGVSGDDLERTIEIEINATDTFQVSEPNRTNNIDDLMINLVPVITFE